jgi:hypothetical protein
MAQKITQEQMHLALHNFSSISNHVEAIGFMRTHDIESEDIGGFFDTLCSDELRDFLVECLEKEEVDCGL